MKREQLVLSDDLNGQEGAATVDFGLDGVTYEIELIDEHQQQLRDALQRYIAAGRRASTPRRAGKGPATAHRRRRSQEVRAWGRAHGLQVPDRGRVPAAVWDAYNAAQATTAADADAPASYPTSEQAGDEY